MCHGNKIDGADWKEQSQGVVAMNKGDVTKIMFLLADGPFIWLLHIGQVRLG